MALTWGDFRSRIRRSILKDLIEITWDDDVLLDLCVWAMDTLCAHTAAVSGITYPAPVGISHTLPENLFSDLETTGLVYLKGTSTTTAVRSQMFQETSDITYSVWGDQLVLSDTPDSDCDLVVRYFAYYPHPTSDSDLIAIPQWSRNAVAHLIGALAQTSVSVQSAGIDRWKEKRDSGNPEDNALRIQQQHMLRVYNEELLRFPRQNRENFFQRLLP